MLQYCTISITTHRCFYHNLVGLYSKHAIQFSVIVFIGLLFLIQEYSSLPFFRNKTIIIIGIVYFSFSCFYFLPNLLSAFMFFTCFIYFLLQTYSSGAGIIDLQGFIFIALMTGVFMTDTPIKKRMQEDWDARFQRSASRNSVRLIISPVSSSESFPGGSHMRF